MREVNRLLWFMLFLAPITVGAAAPDDRLVAAAAAQQTEVVRDLLEKGADAEQPACGWRHRPAVGRPLERSRTAADLLLKAGATVDAADDHGVTPLARACENASAGMVDRLLAAKANPNAAQVNGLTPLMIAARTGNAAVVTALLDAGARVDATTTSHARDGADVGGRRPSSAGRGRAGCQGRHRQQHSAAGVLAVDARRQER